MPVDYMFHEGSHIKTDKTASIGMTSTLSLVQIYR